MKSLFWIGLIICATLVSACDECKKIKTNLIDPMSSLTTSSWENYRTPKNINCKAILSAANKIPEINKLLLQYADFKYSNNTAVCDFKSELFEKSYCSSYKFDAKNYDYSYDFRSIYQLSVHLNIFEIEAKEICKNGVIEIKSNDNLKNFDKFLAHISTVDEFAKDVYKMSCED